MLKFFKWPTLLIAAWWLGWQSHDYWSSRPSISIDKKLVSTPPAERPAENPAQQSQSAMPSSAARPSATQDVPITSVNDKWGSEGWVNEQLALHHYEGVMQALLDSASNRQQDNVRQAIIEHLRRLLAIKDYTHAEQLLSLYLSVEYRDVEALLIQAQLYNAQQQFELAIETLYKARSYEYRIPQIARLIDKIRDQVKQFDKKLQRSPNDDPRLALFERLTTLEPDYSPYFVELARVQISMGNITQARQSLSLVEYDPLVSNQVKQLLNELENDDTFSGEQLAAIPLIRRGDHFLVQAWLNNHTAINLLIDTGASLTMIRGDVLQAAGVSRLAYQSMQRFNTANGVVDASIFVLDSLSMGEQSINNLEVGSLSSEHFQAADGLLGMNFLKHFKFFIDQGESVLRLMPLS